MGEYGTIDGTGIKFGTCDDWRYVRRDECERWLETHAQEYRKSDTPLSIILEDASLLYRFPYPWEDGHTVLDVQRRDMFKPRVTCFLRCEDGENADDLHGEKWVSMAAPGGGFNVNVAVPCPYTAAGRAMRSSGLPGDGSGRYVSIYGERYDENGRGRTIFTCIYCEHPFSLDEGELGRVEPVLAPGNGGDEIKARLQGRPTEGTPRRAAAV